MIEIVNGIIIGEQEETMRGKLYHNGRPQTEWLRGNSDADIRDQALTRTEKTKTDMGEEYRRLFPDGLELRIWDN